MAEVDTEALFEVEFRVDEQRRTIAGLVVPWGVRSRPESTTGHRFLFIGPETLRVPEDPTTVPLRVLHNPNVEVGHAIAFEVRADGLHAVFAVDEGPAGDAALRAAASGRWSFSLGTPAKAVCGPCDIRGRCDCDVTSGEIEEVSLVRTPGFPEAQIYHVAASASTEEGITAVPVFEGAKVTAVTASLSIKEGAMSGENENKTGDSGTDKKTGGATVLENEQSAMARFEAELNERFDKIGEKLVDSQVKLSESVTEAVSNALTSVFEQLEGSAAADRAKAAGARLRVKSEEPVYRFDGSPRSSSMVRDFWRAQTERDHDAIERLRKFQEQQRDMVDLLQRIPPFARAQFAVDTTTAADVIPPGYRPDLFVNELMQGRPIVSQASRGTITDATPFVVPRFVTAAGATDDHTEGVNPTPGTLTIDQVTVSPGAISGSFELTREIVDAANPAIDAIALAAMRESYNQQTEAKAYAILNLDTNVGFSADVSLAAFGTITDDVAITPARDLLARYHFTRFAAPTGAVMGQLVTRNFANAKDAQGRALVPSIGAQNATAQGNAVTQAWSVDGLAFQPAWAVTENVGDELALVVNRADWWVWESPLLTFRFEEKQGPAIIELALFAYYATQVLRPAGIFSLRAIA